MAASKLQIFVGLKPKENEGSKRKRNENKQKKNNSNKLNYVAKLVAYCKLNHLITDRRRDVKVK